MKHAIAELEIALQSAVTNEPIHRAEGNAEQADLCAGRIPELREAIGVLQRHEELRVPDGSRLSAADAARITADAHPMAAQHRLSWMLADIEQTAREGGTSAETPTGLSEGHQVIDLVASELRGLGYTVNAFVPKGSEKMTLTVSWGSPAPAEQDVEREAHEELVESMFFRSPEPEIPAEFLEPCGTARTPAAIAVDEPRTIRQWLETLPDGYRERALVNLVEGRDDFEAGDLATAIGRAFCWGDSPEGTSFWSTIRLGEGFPPLPEA